MVVATGLSGLVDVVVQQDLRSGANDPRSSWPLVVADGCLEGMARPDRVFWILSGITFRAETDVGGFV